MSTPEQMIDSAINKAAATQAKIESGMLSVTVLLASRLQSEYRKDAAEALEFAGHIVQKVAADMRSGEFFGLPYKAADSALASMFGDQNQQIILSHKLFEALTRRVEVLRAEQKQSRGTLGL